MRGVFDMNIRFGNLAWGLRIRILSESSLPMHPAFTVSSSSSVRSHKPEILQNIFAHRKPYISTIGIHHILRYYTAITYYRVRHLLPYHLCKFFLSDPDVFQDRQGLC